MKKTLISLGLICSLMCVFFGGTSMAAESYTLDVLYESNITEESAVFDINITFTNSTAESKNALYIAVLFDENNFSEDMAITNLNVEGNSFASANLTLETSGDLTDKYIKCFAVENLTSLKTLGPVRIIHNLNPEISEQYTYITANEGEETSIYLKTDDSENSCKYVVYYNPEHMEVTDLCGLTYEKEINTGEIYGTGIIVEENNCETGKIVINVERENGWTGYNNLIKFKARKNLSNEKVAAYVIPGGEQVEN